jgi:hypothetical protein
MPVPCFQLNILERICDVLADTSTGFTGSEIGKLLMRLSIADPQPQMTKRHRLYEALRQRRIWTVTPIWLSPSSRKP